MYYTYKFWLFISWVITSPTVKYLILMVCRKPGNWLNYSSG